MNAAVAVNGREKGARKRNQFVKRHTCYTERNKLIEVLAIAETPPLQFREIRAYFISRRMRHYARQLAQYYRKHTSALRLSNPDALIFARSNRIVIIRGISDQSAAACSSVACQEPLRFRVIADYVPGTADFSTHFY